MAEYSWNAEDYAKHSNSQQKWGNELLEKLNLKGGEKVLDLGCGDGRTAARISRLVPEGSVVGVDYSTSMITSASETYPPSEYPNLSFQVMDARELAFDVSFNIVFSNAVLHWIQDQFSLLEGIYGCLRPGGKFLMQMGGKGNAREMVSTLDEVRLDPEWGQFFIDFDFPFAFLGVEEYKDLLRYSGFNISRIELIKKDMVHQDQEDFEGWIRTAWLPYTECVPEEKRDDFIQLIASRYIERVPLDDEGKVHVEMVRLEVDAERPG